MIYIDLEYGFMWIGRLIIVWDVDPIEVGFYGSDHETQLWGFSIGEKMKTNIAAFALLVLLIAALIFTVVR